MPEYTRIAHSLCFALLAGASACGPSAVETPSWASDIAPILAANCVRCHTVPAIGGAPAAFRLDSYDDWVDEDGRVIRGASTMIDFIIARINDTENPMPPRFGLADHQIATIQNWAELTRLAENRPPRGEPRPGNRPPTMTIRETRPMDGRLLIGYEIRDPDGDIVLGELRFGSVAASAELISTGLHSGRGEVVWDSGIVPQGNYKLFAMLDDGSAETTLEVTSLDVAHPNVAPSVRLVSPRADALIASAESPTFDVVIDVQDPDSAPGELEVTIGVYLDDMTLYVAEEQQVMPGENIIPWDISDVPEGLSWRMEVTVSDGMASRTVQSGAFIVSHATTTETYDGMLASALESCIACHPARLIPGLNYNFGLYQGDEATRGVLESRGLIYRRVIQQRNMPPVSFTGQSPTADELDRLATWLLAGAPER